MMNIFEAARLIKEAEIAKSAQASKTIAVALQSQPASVMPAKFNVFSIGAANTAPIAPATATIAVPAIQLNAEQQLAVNTFTCNTHGALIGYAGTGKTTTLKQALVGITASMEVEEHDCQHLSAIGLPHEALPFVMCAFTGMAVKAMKRAVGNDSGFQHHCFTIHKLLDYGPVEMECKPNATDIKNGANPFIPIIKRVMKPRRDSNNKLPFKILVIDEVSMLGVALFNELIAALPEDCRIYVIGDIAQLPPVFGSSVMPHLATAWPSVELTQIYRQKDGSMIDNANRIRRNEQPVQSDLFRMGAIAKEPLIAQSQLVKFITNEFTRGAYDPTSDIILCTNNVGPVGQEMLNILLRPVLNKSPHPVTNIGTMRAVKQFRIGDRVMNTKNNPDKGIYNGMLGWVVDIKVNYGMDSEARKLNPTDRNAQAAVSTKSLDDVLMAAMLEEAEAHQKADALAKKMNNMFEGGTRVIDTGDDDDQGTASRQATHQLIVKFDDLETPVTLHTSGELETTILAWCITVHKAQGSGFRNVYIVLHDTGGQLLTNELLYTAVTRCEQSVSVMTTKFAWNRALQAQRIKGKTLAEKMRNYLEVYGGKDDGALKNLRIPRNEHIAEENQ